MKARPQPAGCVVDATGAMGDPDQDHGVVTGIDEESEPDRKGAGGIELQEGGGRGAATRKMPVA
jgi:hypothetical protein